MRKAVLQLARFTGWSKKEIEDMTIQDFVLYSKDAAEIMKKENE